MILIKNGRLVDPLSKRDEVVDIVIEKDKIKEILNQVEISENERAENISIDKFIELIDIFEGR